MARLSAIVRSRAELDPLDVERMHCLYAAYYDAAPQDQFRSDLAGKDFVIELREGAELRGFSTLALMDFARGERRAIYSGDTIIDRRYWGEQVLAHAFCAFAGRIKAAAPAVPLYWFLISKGHRTYRYLGVFAHRYFPSPAEPACPEAKAWIDELAARRFGAAYVPELGLVRFPRSRGHLKAEWAGVRDAVRERAEARFFLERNPRYHEGDELCCLAALEIDNLRSLARKAFIEGMHDDRLLPSHLGKRGALSRPAAAGGGDAEAAPPRAASA
jgi:hypothetical protein